MASNPERNEKSKKMKKIISFLIFIIINQSSFSQQFTRLKDESTENFIERVKPKKNYEISGKIVETKKWNTNENLIFAFYLVKTINNSNKEAFEETFLEGYIFEQISENEYKRIFIDSYGQEGADAEIETIFFSNADKDKSKELIILCSWNQSRHYGISGSLYQVYVYDEIGVKSKELKKIDKFEKIFGTEFNGTDDSGEKHKAKYMNAKQIKEKLKNLGY